jgi:hypothetical protein
LLRAVLWSLFYSEPGAADYAAQGALHRRLAGFAGITWEGMTAQVAGTTGILLHSVVLTLFLVVPLRWLRPAGGAIAAIMLWSGLLVAAATDSLLYLPAVAAGALAGEAVWARVRRGGWGGPDGEAGYWALAAAVPLAQFAAYFALMAAVGGGVAWPPSLVAGAPLMAAFYGLVAGMLAVPPRFVRAARAL